MRTQQNIILYLRNVLLPVWLSIGGGAVEKLKRQRIENLAAFIYLSTHYKNFVSLEINASLRVIVGSSLKWWKKKAREREREICGAKNKTGSNFFAL